MIHSATLINKYKHLNHARGQTGGMQSRYLHNSGKVLLKHHLRGLTSVEFSTCLRAKRKVRHESPQGPTKPGQRMAVDFLQNILARGAQSFRLVSMLLSIPESFVSTNWSEQRDNVSFTSSSHGSSLRSLAIFCVLFLITWYQPSSIDAVPRYSHI